MRAQNSAEGRVVKRGHRRIGIQPVQDVEDFPAELNVLPFEHAEAALIGIAQRRARAEDRRVRFAPRPQMRGFVTEIAARKKPFADLALSATLKEIGIAKSVVGRVPCGGEYHRLSSVNASQLVVL